MAADRQALGAAEEYDGLNLLSTEQMKRRLSEEARPVSQDAVPCKYGFLLPCGVAF